MSINFVIVYRIFSEFLMISRSLISLILLHVVKSQVRENMSKIRRILSPLCKKVQHDDPTFWGASPAFTWTYQASGRRKAWGRQSGVRDADRPKERLGHLVPFAEWRRRFEGRYFSQQRFRMFSFNM